MTRQPPTDLGEDTHRVILQGRALVRAIQALETIEPSSWFERAISGVLVKAYRRRLRAIIGAAPSWVGGRILEAMEIDGVQQFIVACPKDVTMYMDALKTTGQEDRLVVRDLIELVHEALEPVP